MEAQELAAGVLHRLSKDGALTVDGAFEYLASTSHAVPPRPHLVASVLSTRVREINLGALPAAPVSSRVVGMQRPTGSCHLLGSSVGLLRLAYSPFRSPPSSLLLFYRDFPPCYPPQEPLRPATLFRLVPSPQRSSGLGRSCFRR